MTIVVNGQLREVPSGTSMRDLLAMLQMDLDRVAVEHNRTILPKACFAATFLVAGDTVEIVQFVGGG